jgi:hypothetical protein
MWLVLSVERSPGGRSKLTLHDARGVVTEVPADEPDRIETALARWLDGLAEPAGRDAARVTVYIRSGPGRDAVAKLVESAAARFARGTVRLAGRDEPVPVSAGTAAPELGDHERVGADEAEDQGDDVSFTAPVPDEYLEGGRGLPGRLDGDVASARPPLGEARGPEGADEAVPGPRPGVFEKGADEPQVQPIAGVAYGRPASEEPRAAMARPRLHEPQAEGRSVDLALRRKGFASELVGDEDDPQDVRPSTRLAAGRRYELQVRIGAPLHGTLFEAPPPPIDPLLPPSEDGHRLEVTVFGLDFTLEKRAVRALWLPRTGPTSTVGFPVTAPSRVGPARLRVVISHDGHALQSFVLTAQIAHAEERAPGRALNATLEHAATAQFANLDALRPREATAVINDDAGGHSITLKRGDATGTFAFTDAQIRAAADAVRKILEDAARSPSFDEPPPREGTPAFAERRAAYDAVIRALAVLGVQLRNALFMHADAGGRQLIRELAKTADQRLQLIHVARSLVIPWACLYDGQIGPALDVTGWPVCNGVVDGAPCGHTGAEDHQLCVRRFWGLRHDLELVLGSAVPRDAVTAFRMPADRPPLRLIHGKSLQDVQYMPDAYTSLLYQPGVPVWDHDVYSLLDAERRPAIIAALGHFSLATPVAGATVHAIDLVPAPLTDVGVSQQAINAGDWSFPHSIVLLMACSSAVAAADALTGMIDAFGSAGAAAIIGTESTVYPRLSARAATSLYRRLIDGGGKLGTAVRDLRWELVAAATPLAFTFTAYGNADLAREDAT